MKIFLDEMRNPEKYFDKECYKKAIEYYGDKAQKLVAVEELAELQKEILKEIRNTNDPETKTGCIVSEISDVLNMIESLKIIYDISEIELKKNMMIKMNRQMKRIKENEEKIRRACEKLGIN